MIQNESYYSDFCNFLFPTRTVSLKMAKVQFQPKRKIKMIKQLKEETEKKGGKGRKGKEAFSISTY